jgi:hypothetical protein
MDVCARTHTPLDLQMEDDLGAGLGVLDLADDATLPDEDAAMGVQHGSTATTSG